MESIGSEMFASKKTAKKKYNRLTQVDKDIETASAAIKESSDKFKKLGKETKPSQSHRTYTRTPKKIDDVD